MKVYVKIPRYDHPVVPESFFDAEDLVVLEKFDGSSFRFTLYDERHASLYPDPVVNAADGDGSLVSGTRRSIRGSHRDDLRSGLSRCYRYHVLRPQNGIKTLLKPL